jgi:PIN domain nuclease of toxin-antitoxin system
MKRVASTGWSKRRMALLDTVVIVQLIRQSASARRRVDQILRRGGQIHISSISFLEMANKMRVNRLVLSKGMTAGDFPAWIVNTGFNLIDLRMDHIIRAQDFGHPDPYDRLLLAKASIAKVPLITTDAALLEFSGVEEL